AITADGSKIFVTNAADNSISVISASTNSVVATITSIVALETPWGIAIFGHANQQQSPEQMVASLTAAIQGMNIPKLGTSLTDQLHAVANDISSQNGLACVDLRAFANHVKAQTGKSITFAEAQQILMSVATIESALNCGG